MIAKNLRKNELIEGKISEDLNNGKMAHNFFLKIAYNQIGDFHESEDAVNEAYIKTIKNSGDYLSPINEAVPLFEDCKLMCYMKTIVKNSAVDIIRERARFRKPILYSDSFYKEKRCINKTPVSLAIKAERKEIILRSLIELPEKFRTPIQMFYFKGKKYREIAKELNEPLATIEKRIFLAKKRLSKKLEKLLL